MTLKVREVTEKRHLISREAYFAFVLVETKIPNIVKEVANKMLNECCIDSKTFNGAGYNFRNGNYGTAIFRDVKIRDATKEEVNALYYLKMWENCMTPYLCVQDRDRILKFTVAEINTVIYRSSMEKCKKILNGKEIFEVPDE